MQLEPTSPDGVAHRPLGAVCGLVYVLGLTGRDPLTGIGFGSAVVTYLGRVTQHCVADFCMMQSLRVSTFQLL